MIPHKNQNNLKLTEPQQTENQLISSERIVVEHSLTGPKRYWILSERLRLHVIDLYNQIVGIGAERWNFYLFDFS